MRACRFKQLSSDAMQNGYEAPVQVPAAQLHADVHKGLMERSLLEVPCNEER